MQSNSGIFKGEPGPQVGNGRWKMLPTLSGPNSWEVLTLKPARTILFALIFVAVPFFVPKLRAVLTLKGEPYSAIVPNPRALVTFRSNSAPAVTVVPGEVVSESDSSLPPATESSDPCAAQSIADPDRVLDSFYAALVGTDAKKAGTITRITHYGDSPITNDGITGTARRLLQTRFGDAGHGFILIDRPWAWYGHQAITFTSGGGWTTDSFMNPRVRDGAFGLGGVTFRADGPGRYARYAPAAEGQTGRNFSRLEVYYLAQPGGGGFNVSATGASPQNVSTKSESASSGFYELKTASKGANSFEIKTAGGNVRLAVSRGRGVARRAANSRPE